MMATYGEMAGFIARADTRLSQSVSKKMTLVTRLHIWVIVKDDNGYIVQTETGAYLSARTLDDVAALVIIENDDWLSLTFDA